MQFTDGEYLTFVWAVHEEYAHVYPEWAEDESLWASELAVKAVLREMGAPREDLDQFSAQRRS